MVKVRGYAMGDRFLIVTGPVINVRRQPVKATSGYAHDDMQETQVLYNEILSFRDEKEGWYFIEAVEQGKSAGNGKWQGYPGWVEKAGVRCIEEVAECDCVVTATEAAIFKEPSIESEVLLVVSLGTRFRATGKKEEGRGKREEKQGAGIEKQETRNKEQGARLKDRTFCRVITADGGEGWVAEDELNMFGQRIEENELRRRLIDTAKLFPGVPYLWGGRSIPFSDTAFQVSGFRFQVKPPASSLVPRPLSLGGVALGVDCSGLTNLVFRAHNIDIPRDAHDQWLAARRVSEEIVKPGDLIFVSGEGVFDWITHVMLYAGGEEFIEASETDSVARLYTFQEKFGLNLARLRERGFVADNRKLHFGNMIGEYKRNKLRVAG